LQKLREQCDQQMNARGGPLLPMDQRGSKKPAKGKGKAKKAKE
jgi:hypothetical protein